MQDHLFSCVTFVWSMFIIC